MARAMPQKAWAEVDVVGLDRARAGRQGDILEAVGRAGIRLELHQAEGLPRRRSGCAALSSIIRESSASPGRFVARSLAAGPPRIQVVRSGETGPVLVGLVED